MSDQTPPAELWHRTAEVVDVAFAQRTIELVVMPYETEALVPYQGRMVRETIARGAFDGIERRANRVRVNRDHKAERTIGRAMSFHPSRDEGLVAVVRIAQTDLGDETLTLAADGVLDASAAFAPMAPLDWEGRSKYTVSKAWLGHIAMTPDPAYTDARVLSVRNAEQAVILSPTPNLDEVRSWRLADQPGAR